MFEHVEPFAGDPILSLNEDFQKDPRPHKINLSIGIYFDDAGRIPVLESVRRAEQMVVARDAPEALPADRGRANFRAEVQKLLFGAGHEALASGGWRRSSRWARAAASRSAPTSSPGGSRQRGLGQRSELGEPPLDVRRRRPRGRTPIPTTTRPPARWRSTRCARRCASSAESVVLIHACCHNPTGVDLTRDQWDRLIPLLAEGELLPYLDLAYQGFGDGIAETPTRCGRSPRRAARTAGRCRSWSPTRSPRA
jgi:aromatic-amino-acid transaminase